jgi:hypothetical protein
LLLNRHVDISTYSRAVFKLHNPSYNATLNEAINRTDADVFVWQVISAGMLYGTPVYDPLYLARDVSPDFGVAPNFRYQPSNPL